MVPAPSEMLKENALQAFPDLGGTTWFICPVTHLPEPEREAEGCCPVGAMVGNPKGNAGGRVGVLAC